jgi:hypothetical protein
MKLRCRHLMWLGWILLRMPCPRCERWAFKVYLRSPAGPYFIACGRCSTFIEWLDRHRGAR